MIPHKITTLSVELRGKPEPMVAAFALVTDDVSTGPDRTGLAIRGRSPVLYIALLRVAAE